MTALPFFSLPGAVVMRLAQPQQVPCRRTAGRYHGGVAFQCIWRVV